ncbi:hypothetical protein Hypma_000685 [Hypsizygus marmoreus]|uniref:Uncharacterized protein n=1 Tax=Hypsizygus marmoreus TaxID=39966 RepID=A0A369JEU8_HYPMA|nr:hypothetical protein Hypma_000685 [Hypsizygus marmoreus]
MPTIQCRSRIRAVSDLCSLALNVRHHLLAGKASDTQFTLNKTRFPDDVDVLLTSNLVITLSGAVDGSDVSAEDILASSLSGHLVDYFQLNATELGLNTVSKLYIDDEDGLPKMKLTPSRQVPIESETHSVHVVLVALDLCYSWRTVGPSESSDSQPSSNSTQQTSHPFSSKLALPFRTLLDNVIGRFVTWQLVKRYPLIFGPWCQQLDKEAFYFPRMFCSIYSIMERSPNNSFRAKCKRLIKTLRCRHEAKFDQASSSLLTYLSPIHEVEASIYQPTKTKPKTEDVFCLAMERAYRDGMTRPHFKGATQAHLTDPADDEDLSQDHNVIPSEHRTRFDSLWDVPFTDVLPRSLGPYVDPFLFLDMPPSSAVTVPMDLELDHSDEGLPEKDGWSDCEETFEMENAHCYDRHSPVEHDPISSEDDICRDEDCIAAAAVLDFGDDDACCGPFLLSPLQSGHVDDDLMEAAEPETRCLFLVDDIDHVATQMDPSDPVSQDLLGIGPRSQAATSSTSKCSPTISGAPFRAYDASELSQTRDMRNEFQSQWADIDIDYEVSISDYEEDATDSFIAYDPLYDDVDLNILSDTESHMSAITERDSGDNRNLGCGALVAVVAEPATTHSSHQLSTLPVTCCSEEGRGHQLREHEGEHEDKDEGHWHDGELGMIGQDENSIARTNECGEDVLFVMEF